ncbi:MAG: hypothetical protein JWM91_87 [Rhodospirillales bacterium]|nr:hypothetical protein [Rhodospirillales bacterium]
MADQNSNPQPIPFEGGIDLDPAQLGRGVANMISGLFNEFAIAAVSNDGLRVKNNPGVCAAVLSFFVISLL